LLGPTAMYWMGAGMNKIVMAANKGLMPVLVPGGSCPEGIEEDFVHTCMTSTSHMKWLGDWINIHKGVASIGDVFLGLGGWLFWPCLFAWVAAMCLDKNEVIPYEIS